MTVRRILLLTPLLLIFFLLQSYLWVPTYEHQTRGNPDRLAQYVTASIGDATYLNPILSADASSSEIESLVFEGLLDLDEDLRFRPRLASSWEIYEEAFFYVNEDARIPGKGAAAPEEVAELLRKAKTRSILEDARLRASIENIRDITLMPAREFVTTRRVGEKGKGEGTEFRFRVRAPARIRLVLEKVDQGLFESLAVLLGKDYFQGFRPDQYISLEEPLHPGPQNGSQDPQPATRNLQLISAHAAEILPATEHNPVIVFHLKPNVRFHDGHVLDAHDVRFTYDAIMDPKNLSPRLSDFEPVKSMDVLDPLTVRIVYKRLFSPAFGRWSMGILPEHLLNKEALKLEALRLGKDPEGFSLRHSGFNRRPVGAGPFAFREWKSDQFITLDRFEDYWEGPANYRRYAFRIIPDLLTQEMEMYAGTIDAYGGGNPPAGVPPHQAERFEGDPRFQVLSGAQFGYTYIGYNMRREPFSDRRVRTALSMAVDVDKIIRHVLHDQGERITGPFVKQTDYYNHAIPPVPFDPQGAVRILEESGWKKNKEGWLEKDGKRLRFTLISNSGNDIRKAVAAIVQDSWRQIGIDVRTDLIEWSVFIQERVDKADFDALILGWQMDVEPDLFQIWHSSQTNPFQLNFVGFRNPEADALIVRIRQEYDHDRQVSDCHRLHEIIAAEQPYTFLFVRRWTTVLDRRIVIREEDAQGRVRYRKIAPAKTGSFTFHFNKWIKLPHAPNFAPEG